MAAQLELNFKTSVPESEVDRSKADRSKNDGAKNDLADGALAGLNPAQREAVLHAEGPMLVVAGAGTGKTRVLEERIARLVRSHAAEPHEIVAVTYTRKAAGELRSRLAKRLPQRDAEAVRASTFHALCYRILRENGARFQLLEKEELWVYLRRRIEELPLEQFLKAANPARFLNDLLSFFDRCNDELVSAADYARYVRELRDDKWPLPRVHKSKDAEECEDAEVICRCQEIAQVYSKVEQMLAEDNLGSYGSLVGQTITLLRERPELLQQHQEQIKYLLVDEFQDSNHAQIELLRLLGGEAENVFAVGDPDQAIYRFRGASSGAFEEFLRVFPKSKFQALAENYRSTQKILDCAYAVIRRNPEIAGTEQTKHLNLRRQPLRASSVPAGGAARGVEIVPVQDYEEEAADIAEVILRERTQSLPPLDWKSFAVLYRTHSHRELLMKRLAQCGIPFTVKGTDILQTEPARECLALLRCLDLREHGMALFRIALMPQFAIKPEDLQHRLAHAGRDATVGKVLQSFPEGAKVVAAFVQAREALQAQVRPAAQVVAGCIKYFDLDSSSLELRQLLRFVEHWQERPLAGAGKLSDFLEYIELWQEAGGLLDAENPLSEDEAAMPHFYDDEDAVQLLTVHAAKGLEYERCFVTRVASQSFPSQFKEPLFEFPAVLRRSYIRRKDDGTEEGDKQLHYEEERRLFYVAVTRARRGLSLYGRRRGKTPVPAIYLKDLAEDGTLRQSCAIRVPLNPAFEPAVAEAELPVWIKTAPRADLVNEPLSASSVDQYERCSLQFKLQRDWRLPGDVTAPLQYGNVMHGVLRDFNESIRQKRPRNVEQVIDLFRRMLEESGMTDPQQRELYLKHGIVSLTQFVESADLDASVLAAERVFRVEVRGVAVTGRIDRMDSLGENRVAIIDYKTGAPKENHEARQSLQLSVYALAAQELGAVPERLVFYNLQDNTMAEATRTPAELAQAEERIVDVAQGIRDGIFVPRPGRHCNWCAFQELCPATVQVVHRINPAMGAQGC